MSDEFNVNEYWLKRGRANPADETRYAEYHLLQERFLSKTLRQSKLSLQSILELGCGSGRITRLLAEMYPTAQITALDLSTDRLEAARLHCAGAANIRFVQHDFYSDTPLPGAGYDASIAVEVLLHHPRAAVRSLIGQLSAISSFIMNIDWSEAWPWKPPEHVWIHDYQAVYAEAGLNCATFVLPQKIDGMQQKLFIASKKMTRQMVELLGMAEETVAENGTRQNAADSSAALWAEQLQLATAEILQLVPEGDSFILVNDDQWGNEAEFPRRRIIPFLEHEGRYWGPPGEDQTAIRELERLRHAGASHIVFAWPSFWWLDHYTGLRTYLQTHYPCLLTNDRLAVFHLKPRK